MNVQDSRILYKRSTIAGEEPTIPASADHTDGTWLATDIYIGEFFLNQKDDRLWLRTENGILEMNLVASGVGGSGTTGKLAKWSSAVALTDSMFSESGTTASLGTGTSPFTGKFQIFGETSGSGLVLLHPGTGNSSGITMGGVSGVDATNILGMFLHGSTVATSFENTSLARASFFEFNHDNFDLSYNARRIYFLADNVSSASNAAMSLSPAGLKITKASDVHNLASDALVNIKGLGNTSGTYALNIKNSDNNDMARFRNDGVVFIDSYDSANSNALRVSGTSPFFHLIANDAVVSGTWALRVNFYGATQTNLDFYEGGTIRMSIKNGGNVGFGVTVPKAVIHGSVSTILGCASSANADVDLGNSQVNVWVDEGGNNLTFKVKYSGGTVKSGTVALT